MPILDASASTTRLWERPNHGELLEIFQARRRELAATATTPKPQIAHGQYRHFEGTEYRWQQVHSNGWIGILPEHWDDEVDVQNSTKLSDIPWEDLYHMPTRTYDSGHEIDERALLQGLCDVTTSCVRSLKSGVTSVQTAASPYFSRPSGQLTTLARIFSNS